MKKNFVLLILLLLTFPHLGSAQSISTHELQYEVKRIYPTISITEKQLKEAHTLIDLNKHYKASWIKEYISVEILASHKGKWRKAIGKNDTLSQEQKDIMNMADLGTDISVIVQYIPENTLTHNDIKEIDFSFTVDPENEAKYYTGQEQLMQYLKENAIDKIPEGSFKAYELAAIKFIINEEGEIINAHVFESVYQTSRKEKIEKLLLETIRKMPCWKPAEYSNGTKAKQEFALIVGSMESCLVNLLNIRRY